jgi:hypothetical protein
MLSKAYILAESITVKSRMEKGEIAGFDGL